MKVVNDIGSPITTNYIQLRGHHSGEAAIKALKLATDYAAAFDELSRHQELSNSVLMKKIDVFLNIAKECLENLVDFIIKSDNHIHALVWDKLGTSPTIAIDSEESLNQARQALDKGAQSNVQTPLPNRFILRLNKLETDEEFNVTALKLHRYLITGEFA